MDLIFYGIVGLVAVWLIARDKGTPAPAGDKPGELTLPVNCDTSTDPVGCWKATLDKGLAPPAPSVKGLYVHPEDPYGGAFDLHSMPDDMQRAAVAALEYEHEISALLQLADAAEQNGFPLAAVRFRKKAFAMAKASDD